MSKESFKLFASSHQELVSYVKSGEMTWQKFYEIYDMYGEENEVWDEYLTDNETKNTNLGVSDIVNYFKNINLDTVQESINSIQRVLGVVGDLTGNKTTQQNNNNYEPKPIYKHFDD